MVIERTPRVVVIGEGDGLAGKLASLYRSRGAAAEVLGLSEVVPENLGAGPVDVLIVADDHKPPGCPAEDLNRTAMRAAALRLAYGPFRIAVLARPLLRLAGGRLVLLTRTSARMTHEDKDGRFLERPFRAASHTLWRCFSCEWRAEGIETTVVALEDDDEPTPKLIEVIAAYRSPVSGVELIDAEGRVLSW